MIDSIDYRDRPIYRQADTLGWYLGFADIWALPDMADFIGLITCWQNAVIFLTHIIDNLRKKDEPSQDSYLAETLAGAFS